MSRRAPFKIPVRIFGHGPIQPFRDLKAFQIGKYITVQGTVVRVSSVRPFPIKMAFRCSKCMQTLIIQFKDGLYKTPSRCQTTHCTSKVFIPERDSPETECRNWQKIKIQEIKEHNNEMEEEEGRIPRILEAELSADLVDAVVPGEMITLSGILKTLDTNDKGLPNNAGSIYLDVNNILKIRNLNDDIKTTAGMGEISQELQNQIINISQNKTTLQTLVRSFCPHIYGNELVKLGIILSLFGGSKRSTTPTAGHVSIRSDPHILIVGDPGLGKSQLLNFTATVAPRAVYVCANTSSAVGLTATVQDGGLEAGALVLADQGSCCIDEFDKIVGDGWRSLLDVMEQQMVNVAKAGVVCTLPARTSIVAAANPVGGHYNKGKSVVDNLKMDAALLSRFDLIFVLLDKPNADMDKVLSEHVLGNLKGTSQVNKTQRKEAFGRVASMLLSQASVAPETLKEQLDQRRTDIPTISEELFRSYIMFAKKKINPKMTEEAATLLQEFYLELRKTPANDDTLPITTRHLESMIRLCEARAKMELRTFVTIQDARDIIELIRFCRSDVNDPGISNHLGFKKSRPGSKSSALKRFASELIKVSSRTGDIDFTKTQLQTLFDALKITELTFRDLLDALNENGYLLKRSDCYRLLIT